MNLPLPTFKEITYGQPIPSTYDIFQPKFDGIFAFFVVKSGSGAVYSKTSKLKTTLPTTLPDGIYLGEYIRYSAWSGTRPELHGKVVIFDLLTNRQGESLRDVPYQDRLDQIPFRDSETHTRVLKTWKLNQLDHFWNNFVAAHRYEGVVLKQSNGLHSTPLIKCKLQLEQTFYITKLYEGTGRLAGTLGAFGISREPGQPEIARVGSGLTDKLRAEYWPLGDSLTQVPIEVKSYLGFSGEAPRQPVFLRLKL